jgi:hypothetical protein
VQQEVLDVEPRGRGAGFDAEIGVGITPNDDAGYHADLVNSVSASHEIAGPRSGYLEFFSSVPTQHSGNCEGTVDVGSMLTIGRDFQLDGGINIGVTHGADDLQPFLDASYRF